MSISDPDRREAAEMAAALLRETFPGMADAELADMASDSNLTVHVSDLDIEATAALDDPPAPSAAVLGAFFARKETPR